MFLQLCLVFLLQVVIQRYIVYWSYFSRIHSIYYIQFWYILKYFMDKNWVSEISLGHYFILMSAVLLVCFKAPGFTLYWISAQVLETFPCATLIDNMCKYWRKKVIFDVLVVCIRARLESSGSVFITKNTFLPQLQLFNFSYQKK